tara:strand:+ start:1017 stop:1199 length:183 start_codon:yes stop_codon:yes gene_type:complete
VTILVMTIPVTFLLVSFFVIAFVVAAKKNQFKDLETPAHAMLIENEENEDLMGRKTEHEK